MRALCKKTIDRCEKNYWYSYEVSEEYNSYLREYETFMYVYTYNQMFNDYYECFSERDFFDHFYTNQELRQLKLEKLYEISDR